MAEQAKRNDHDLLLDRLFSAFGRKKVTKYAEIVGASGHVWTVVGQVRSDQIVAAFDCATPFAASVYGIHTKFADIRHREKHLHGVITVPQIDAFKEKQDHLKLLKQAANDVIEIESPEEEYRRAAA